MPSQEITHGSLAQIAQNGRSIAEAFATGVEAIICVDTSASMRSEDCQNGQSRHDVACAELRRLQRQIPGKLAIIEWAESHALCPGGVPGPAVGFSTNMAGVLHFVHVADDCGIRIILISDGEPDSQDEAMRAARMFKTKIDTIYVGPEGGHGADFLRRLAAATGGRFEEKNARGIAELAPTITRMLTA